VACGLGDAPISDFHEHVGRFEGFGEEAFGFGNVAGIPGDGGCFVARDGFVLGKGYGLLLLLLLLGGLFFFFEAAALAWGCVGFGGGWRSFGG